MECDVLVSSNLIDSLQNPGQNKKNLFLKKVLDVGFVFVYIVFSPGRREFGGGEGSVDVRHRGPRRSLKRESPLWGPDPADRAHREMGERCQIHFGATTLKEDLRVDAFGKHHSPQPEQGCRSGNNVLFSGNRGASSVWVVIDTRKAVCSPKGYEKMRLRNLSYWRTSNAC